ncbi:MAG: hypothetical protein NT079_01825, partial [Candidatus Omnitrophica bacterium]|nr:hypothetical protein [Candidatus Omnitrophota bacterium]
KLKTTPKDFILKALSFCTATEIAEHGEGFWIDHWTYNLDLVESYLSVFPERLAELLLEKKVFTFYHNSFYVLPRHQRYILTSRGPRQYHSVARMSDEMLETKVDNNLRVTNGRGNVCTTHLLAKFICLVANKASSLDPSGIGIEMEADKPGWYDALNGLPGLLGSSTCETIELKRFCLFLLESFNKMRISDHETFEIFEELYVFVKKLTNVLRDEPDPFLYWEKSNQAKEYYRLSVIKGIGGREKKISVEEIKKFLTLIIRKTDKAIKLATDKKGCIATYFSHEIIRYKKLKSVNQHEMPFVTPLAFKRHALPLFLEGFVHAFRVEKDKARAKKLYAKVRASELFDQKLKMYRVNADISKESSEIGRARIFPAGWLENQSIWVHMEYKFLLELLRTGLCKEFYENLPHTLIPFLNPQQYGRSILENSSFIASSAHEDPEIHGRGYVARLSGSTAEFLHMWLLMNMGQQPFYLDGKRKLNLAFKPMISKNLFTQKAARFRFLNKNSQWEMVDVPKNTYAFNFMASTLVVYHNPKRIDTFDPQATIKKITCVYYTGKKVEIIGGMIPSPYAQEVREGAVKRIDAFL